MTTAALRQAGPFCQANEWLLRGDPSFWRLQLSLLFGLTQNSGVLGIIVIKKINARQGFLYIPSSMVHHRGSAGFSTILGHNMGTFSIGCVSLEWFFSLTMALPSFQLRWIPSIRRKSHQSLDQNRRFWTGAVDGADVVWLRRGNMVGARLATGVLLVGVGFGLDVAALPAVLVDSLLGAFVGGRIGAFVGDFVGALLGFRVGATTTGFMVGAGTAATGFIVGADTGALVGAGTGLIVEATIGFIVGAGTGALMGADTGALDGATTGFIEGATTGFIVGAGTGALVCAATGLIVGAGTGFIVGAGTGALMGAGTEALVGATTGFIEGATTGFMVGAGTGDIGGAGTGFMVGAATGAFEPDVNRIDAWEGDIVGDDVGLFDGVLVGAFDGFLVGALDGGRTGAFVGEEQKSGLYSEWSQIPSRIHWM
jgi:hypothetical protein